MSTFICTPRLLYGDSAPFLSLIGVSLATGGILTRDDELEGVCWEIREAVSRLQGNWGRETVSQAMTADFGLGDLDIGPPIAKGCAAVVYAAAIKPNIEPSDRTVETATNPTGPPMQPHRHEATTLMSPIQNTSRFVHNLGGSVDNVNNRQQQQSRSATIVDEFRRRSMATTALQTTPKRPRCSSIDDESEYERTFNSRLGDRRAATTATDTLKSTTSNMVSHLQHV